MDFIDMSIDVVVMFAGKLVIDDMSTTALFGVSYE
jgi:hypothetical protein